MGASPVWPLVLALLGGCITQSDSTGYGGGGWGTGPGGTGGDSGFGCHQDSDCPGEVCARNGACLPASQVWTVHINWTLKGQPASTTTCANAPDLDLTFTNSGNSFGFSPVPCVEGRFTVDKLPTLYMMVGLQRTGDYNGAGVSTRFDTTGNASLDLPY